MEYALQILVNGVSLSLTYVLVALGLTLVLGMMEILNMAHGAIYMAGAYILYMFTRLLGLDYVPAALISIVLTGVLGLLIERIAIRPVFKERLLALLTTLGMAMMLEQSALLIFGPTGKSVASPFKGVLNILGVTTSMERVAVIVISILALIIFYLYFTRTKQGQAMRAVGQNSEAAALCGINPSWMFAASMFAGSALAAMAAVLTAPLFSITSTMGFAPMFKGFIIVILGGVGSIRGCVVAGFIIGFIDSAGATVLGYEVASMLGFALLMVMIIFRPTGLMPRHV